MFSLNEETKKNLFTEQQIMTISSPTKIYSKIIKSVTNFIARIKDINVELNARKN